MDPEELGRYMATGSTGRKQWEKWVENGYSRPATTGNTVNTSSGNTPNSVNLPYIPLPRHRVDLNTTISRDDVAEALKLMGIDIDPDDICSILMEPDSVTVERYVDTRSNQRERVSYPIVTEKDQDTLWDWRTAV